MLLENRRGEEGKSRGIGCSADVSKRLYYLATQCSTMRCDAIRCNADWLAGWLAGGRAGWAEAMFYGSDGNWIVIRVGRRDERSFCAPTITAGALSGWLGWAGLDGWKMGEGGTTTVNAVR